MGIRREVEPSLRLALTSSTNAPREYVDRFLLGGWTEQSWKAVHPGRLRPPAPDLPGTRRSSVLR